MMVALVNKTIIAIPIDTLKELAAFVSFMLKYRQKNNVVMIITISIFLFFRTETN